MDFTGMPARQAALIRQIVAFVYRLIIRLIPHRLIPRLKSFSWKLSVPRPLAILSEYGLAPFPEYRGFDQWKANTREDTAMIVTEVPRIRLGGQDHTLLRPRIASWGYAPPPSPSSSDDSRNY